MKGPDIIRKKQRGFTLLEIVMVIAIIGILFTMAVPAILNWLPDYRLKSAAGDLVANFQRVKMEAVKRSTNVVISFTTGSYTPGGRVGSYIIFVDDGGGGGIAGNYTRDGAELVVARITMPKQVSLVSVNFGRGAKVTGYNFRGLPNKRGNVELKNSNLRRYKAILSWAGYVRLEMSSDDGAGWS